MFVALWNGFEVDVFYFLDVLYLRSIEKVMCWLKTKYVAVLSVVSYPKLKKVILEIICNCPLNFAFGSAFQPKIMYQT